jgi:hypothetical protein
MGNALLEEVAATTKEEVAADIKEDALIMRWSGKC